MTKPTKPGLRIGIYAGTFDPVHSGHIAFALQAIQHAQLDEVIFLPERKPRYKPAAEHFAHRVAMLKAAIKPHQQLSVAEVVDRQFTVRRTLVHLRAVLPTNAQLVFLIGSDTVATVPTWNHAEQLLASCELVVAVRQGHHEADIQALIADWSQPPLAVTVFTAHAPHVSSTTIRAALRKGRAARGLLTSVRGYARRQWLYVSLDQTQN